MRSSINGGPSTRPLSLALLTGDGLCVVDVDPRNGGAIPKGLGGTLTASTPSGGIHLFYRYGTTETLRNNNTGLLGTGVDFKARRGYVIVPPADGREWIVTCEPARLPGRFVALLRLPDRKHERHTTATFPVPREARGLLELPEHVRRADLVRYAYQLADAGYGEAPIYAELVTVATARGVSASGIDKWGIARIAEAAAA